MRYEFSGRVIITWPAVRPGQSHLSAPTVAVHDAETGELIPCTRLLIGQIEPTSGPITAEVHRLVDENDEPASGAEGTRAKAFFYLVAEMRTADGFDPSKSINEQRVARGLPPLEMPEADRPLWRTETGVTLGPPQ